MSSDNLCSYCRILDISGCHQGVTDSGVIALARLPQLNSLTLSYLNKVIFNMLNCWPVWLFGCASDW